MSARDARNLPPAPAALAAFMRGVERRAAIFAELQAGDADAGDAAVESALYLFRDEAGRLPMNEWPPCFWALLMAQPALQRHAGVAIPLEATDRLAELGHGPRAALLLQLAAGLDEAGAARAMGVAPAGYSLAIEQALTAAAGGLPALQAWRQLREQVQRRIRSLPVPRLSRLARVREAALRGDVPVALEGTEELRPRPRGLRRRGLLALLWLLLAGCVLAFAATFWWPFPGFNPFINPFDWGSSSSVRASRDTGQVMIEPLPTIGPPAQRYDPVTALITHPDFERLADPGLAAVADELALYSWLVADGAGTPDPMLPVLEDAGDGEEAEMETGDAP
ncbi:hypothetical protein [Marilutibacter alkalisoli]|uniref:Uncharacterized protein n=1 Tax=Marilutibacter alkalisoli TaxID=2591633 RepID=A0A514BVB2_9GAMM|nr:hypothetical protein [Lysobacter alkalisoli]QDH71297.1 hypothetical protein FKV23_15275 [Lysobacter alkalisoli]